MNKNKIFFFVFWILILALVPVEIFKDISVPYLLKNPTVLFNTLQRAAGSMVFITLFFYIVLDSFKEKFVQKLGNWVPGFVLFNGIIGYLFIILYQLSFLLVNYFAGHGLDPFYVFTDVCVLCASKFETFYTLGRVSFWLLTVSVLAWFFKDTSKWLGANWKKLQNLNYLSFFLISALLFFTVSDIIKSPFIFFYVTAFLTAVIIFGYKLLNFVKSLV